MQKRTWTFAALGLIAGVALLAWAFAPRPLEVESAPVARGHFEATIDEDGRTRLRERFVVSSPLAGRLARITWREGDAVQAGAVLASLTPVLSPLQDERTRRELVARLGTGEAQVQRAVARVAGAQVALQQARNEHRRSEQLAAQGYVSPTKLEADRLAAEAALRGLDAAEQERHMAEHDLEQSHAALDAVAPRAVPRAGAIGLTSPIDGRVLRVLQGSEATVPAGTPLLELGDTRSLEVVAELLTADALRAQPGSRVLIERWGGEGILEGRVRLVEPSAFTKVSALGVEEQRVKVLIDLTSPPDRWRALGDGFRVGVRVVTLSAENVMLVPVAAVFPLPTREGDRAPGMAVFVVDGARARLAPVRVRARNGQHAWIEEGLAPGDAVIVYPPATVSDGSRIKVRQV